MELSYDQILENNNFLIIIHQKPDGDCVGAALAFSEFLNRLNKKSIIIVKDTVPEKLKYLPANEKVMEQAIAGTEIKQKFDVVVFLDCASYEISGFGKNDFDDKKIINIDHHVTNPEFGDINLVDAASCATCEILFDLFQKWKVRIDKKMAINLFSGIFTDTGGFQHSNTNFTVLKKAAILQSYGVNVAKISKTVFMTKSMSGLKVLGLALQRLRHNKTYNLVYSVITQKDQQKLGANEEDMEGIVQLIAKCPFVNATMFIYQTKDNCIKGSFRTEKNNVDVSRLASALYGGGHKKASGFKFPGKIVNKNNQWLII